MKKKRSSVPILAGLVLLAATGGAAVYLLAGPGDSLRSLLDGIIPAEKTPASDGSAPAQKGRVGADRKSAGSEGASSGPAAGTRPADIAAAPPAKPVQPPADTAAFEAVLEKARACCVALEYEEALRLIEDLLSGPLPKDLRSKAERIERASGVFLSVLAGISPLELSDYRDLVEVRLTNGNSVVGRILSDSPSKVVVMQDYGIKANLSRDEIDRINPLPPEKMKKIKEAEYEKFRMNPDAVRGDAVSCFLLAEFCVRNGLRDKVNALLEKGLDADGMFQTIVYNEKAKRIYRQYLYFKGKKMDSMSRRAFDSIREKFPESVFARQAKADEQEATVMAQPRKTPAEAPANPAGSDSKTPARPPETSEDDWGDDSGDDSEKPAPKPPPDSRGGLIEQAKKLMREARAREEASEPGRPDADAELAKAIAVYEKAAETLEKALKTNPEHAGWIESQLEEVQSSIYWCRKRSKVS